MNNSNERFSAVVKISFSDSTTNALLDTGASCSLIDIGSLQKLGLEGNIQKSQHDNLIDASGNNMNITGSILMKIKLAGKVLQHRMLVLNTKSFKNVILGRDFLSRFSAFEIDFHNNKIKLGTHWLNCVDITEDRKVQLVSSLVLQGRSENFVTVKCDQSFSLVTADFEPVQLSESPGVYATRCRIIPNIEGCFQVSFLNINPCSVSIPANTHIGFLTTSKTTVAQIAQQDKSTSTNLEDSIVYGENLSNDEKTKILDIISNFKTIFAPNPKKPTLVRNMEHKIITNDAQPVKRKPYRIPYAYLEETEKQITEMLNNDIIRPSSSPWNAPVILVKRKMGPCVLCVTSED